VQIEGADIVYASRGDGIKKAVPERIYFLVPPVRFEKSFIGVVMKL
jgi:hypothetical protein